MALSIFTNTFSVPTHIIYIDKFTIHYQILIASGDTYQIVPILDNIK